LLRATRYRDQTLHTRRSYLPWPFPAPDEHAEPPRNVPIQRKVHVSGQSRTCTHLQSEQRSFRAEKLYCHEQDHPDTVARKALDESNHCQPEGVLKRSFLRLCRPEDLGRTGERSDQLYSVVFQKVTQQQSFIQRKARRYWGSFSALALAGSIASSIAHRRISSLGPVSPRKPWNILRGI